jgi:hypothetical protein
VKRLLAILFIGGALSCGQGIGDRCQVDQDCKGFDTGVVCNKATNTCQNQNGGSLDATVPPMIDASIDAGSGSGSGSGI